MEKIMYGKIVAITTLLLMVAVPVLPAVAQDDTGISTDTSEVIEELEGDTDDAGILPTNPFYFLKEWGRGLRRAFIFNPVKRAQFELDVTDEKADELEEVSELEGENETGIERAASNYEKAVERLRLRLEQLDEDSNNPNVQELLEKLAERTTEHQELIERLRVKYEQFESLRLRLEEARGEVEGTIDSVINGIETIQEFRERFRTGDAELREELRLKWQEFRSGVESSGAFNRLDDFEGELRYRMENRVDGLRERFELRQEINGEKMRLRFENRSDDDDELEDEDEDEVEEENEDEKDELDEDDEDEDNDRDDSDDSDENDDNSGSGSRD